MFLLVVELEYENEQENTGISKEILSCALGMSSIAKYRIHRWEIMQGL